MTHSGTLAPSQLTETQILSPSGDVLIPAVSLCSRPENVWQGGTHQGSFAVPDSQTVPQIAGETVQISSSDGTTTSAVITKIAGNTVHFRSRGPGSA